MKVKNLCFFYIFLTLMAVLGGLGSLFFIKKPVHLEGSLEMINFEINQENENYSCEYLLKWNEPKWKSHQVLDKMISVQIFNHQYQREYQKKNFNTYNLQTLKIIDEFLDCRTNLKFLIKMPDERILLYLISIVFPN